MPYALIFAIISPLSRHDAASAAADAVATLILIALLPMPPLFRLLR